MKGLTVEVAPARDVALVVMGRNLPSLGQTGRLNVLIHDGALVQLQQGHVITMETKPFYSRETHFGSKRSFMLDITVNRYTVIHYYCKQEQIWPVHFRLIDVKYCILL